MSAPNLARDPSDAVVAEVMSRIPANPIVIDDLFPAPLLQSASEALGDVGYRYGWHSAGRSSNDLVAMQRHWHYEVLGGDAKNTLDLTSTLISKAEDDRVCREILTLWRAIAEHEFAPHPQALLRCYVNQHTYGTEGYPHRDSKRPGETSIIVYLNNIAWKPEWGGETAFYDETGEITKSVMPKFGRVVLFPSETMHAARSLSRICVLARRTLVYKARVPA
jgi:SM-20-related protein